jgi:CheY-like chemotaxis protein
LVRIYQRSGTGAILAETKHNHCILLVEDDDAVRAIVTRMLVRNGYEVRGAADAEQAIRQMVGFHPSLLVMDMNLPGMHGLDLVHLLRGKRLELPAIAITGEEMEEFVAMASGFSTVVLKPFTEKELISAITRTIY